MVRVVLGRCPKRRGRTLRVIGNEGIIYYFFI
jgi:hypothetical protein